MQSTQDLIEKELLRLCQEGHFEAFLLFDNEGIPMAGVNLSEHYHQDGIAALSALLIRSAELTEEFNADAVIDEITLRTVNNFRIVGRTFLAHETRLMLVAIVPQHYSYRQITTEAVRKVRQLF